MKDKNEMSEFEECLLAKLDELTDAIELVADRIDKIDAYDLDVSSAIENLEKTIYLNNIR